MAMTERGKYLKHRRETVGRHVPPRWVEILMRGMMRYDEIMDFVYWGFSSPPDWLIRRIYR